MGDVTCTPWRRYGHDRVYVADGGTRLGYLDCLDGSVVVDDEAHREDVVAALVTAGHLSPPPAPPAPQSDPEPWALTLPGDTATYRPGAGARRMAAERRAEAPVRTALARLLDVHTDERAWRRGAEGEEAVARTLDKLPLPWLALHDLPIGDNGANVDHLAIGPGGVFTMNTKNLSADVWVGGDTFLCEGHRQPYVRNARHEARRVARLLSAGAGSPVVVHGMVVVLAPEVTVRRQPADVTVVTRRDVKRWLQRRPSTLSLELIRTLERVARDPRTWRHQPPEAVANRAQPT